MSAVVRVLVIPFLGLLLASCATNQHMVNGRMTLPPTIQAEEGVLLLKLVGVQPLSSFNAKWGTLKLANKQNGQAVELYDTAPPLSSYSLFMGTLPKGQYEIKGVGAAPAVPGTFGVLPALALLAMTSDSQSLESQLGTFTVRPGALTNLGMVVSALPEEKGQKVKLAVLADERGRATALTDAEPTAKERLTKFETRSWDSAPPADAADKALDIVRAHARNISSIESTSDNRILIGSALGMIHVRSAEGTWSSMSVGSLDTITYARALDDGRMFAGTDTGKYFLWLPDQKRWQERTLTGSDYKIVYMEPMGQAGFAIQAASLIAPALSMPTKTKMFFTSKLEDAGAAKELLSIDGASAIGRLPVFYTGEELQVFFNHMGISRTADLYRINPVTHEKKVDKTSYWAAELYRLPNGTVALNRMNGMTVYNSFSTDNGRTWTHNRTGGPNSVRFLDPVNGYGFSTVSTGWSVNTIGLNKTKDGGKTWERIGTVVDGAGIMPIRFVNGRLFVFTGQRLLSTADEGQTWNTEWPLKTLTSANAGGS